MRCLKLTVKHVDFEFDVLRRSFYDAMVNGWNAISETLSAQSEAEFLDDGATVLVFFPYTEDVDAVRKAEEAAAAAMASISIGVMQENAKSEGPVLAAYSFDIERNVEMPTAEAPASMTEAESPQT